MLFTPICVLDTHMNHPPYHFIEIQKKTVYVEMFQITQVFQLIHQKYIENFESTLEPLEIISKYIT